MYACTYIKPVLVLVPIYVIKYHNKTNIREKDYLHQNSKLYPIIVGEVISEIETAKYNTSIVKSREL